MKVAITGAGGFIGTELREALRERENVNIIALTRDASRYTDDEHCKWLSTDYSCESLTEALDGADVVVHLAGVRGMEDDPKVFAPNLEMTENLLAAMKSAGTDRIVFASSVAVYNGREPMPWAEDATLKGYRAYGDSKAECEEAIIKASEDCGYTYAIVRIAQVLGKGERRRGMMNVFLDTAREHGTLTVMGKSVIRRQYLYIKDLVEVIAILATEAFDGAGAGIPDGRGSILNVGMPNAYTNLEIARMVNEVYENPTDINYEDSYPETGRAFHMDISRLRNELGYEPMDMKEALEDYRNLSYEN